MLELKGNAKIISQLTPNEKKEYLKEEYPNLNVDIMVSVIFFSYSYSIKIYHDVHNNFYYILFLYFFRLSLILL